MPLSRRDAANRIGKLSVAVIAFAIVPGGCATSNVKIDNNTTPSSPVPPHTLKLVGLTGANVSLATAPVALLTFVAWPIEKLDESQLVIARSMARQFGQAGAQVLLLDAAGTATSEQLSNTQSDLASDNIIVVEHAAQARNSLSVFETPTTIIYCDGLPAQAWRGEVALSQDIALLLQAKLGAAPTSR